MMYAFSLQVDNSSRRGRRGRGGESSEESSPPQDGAVFDQWEAANSGGLGGAGSVTRQKVGIYCSICKCNPDKRSWCCAYADRKATWVC